MRGSPLHCKLYKIPSDTKSRELECFCWASCEIESDQVTLLETGMAGGMYLFFNLLDSD